MDNLTSEQKIKALEAAWHVSLSGWATVDKDFIFQSVNRQWLELLGALPSDFLGRSFEDITPLDTRSLDVKNARLVIEGKISGYMIRKSFRFQNGSIKRIVQLVVRVPQELDQEFQFFLIRILLDEAELVQATAQQLPSASLHRPTLSKFLDFLVKYWPWLASASAVATGIILKIMGIKF